MKIPYKAFISLTGIPVRAILRPRGDLIPRLLERVKHDSWEQMDAKNNTSRVGRWLPLFGFFSSLSGIRNAVLD